MAEHVGDFFKVEPINAQGTVRVRIPDPRYVVIVASDGEVYGMLPVSRELLADAAPRLDEVITDGLERVRRD